jgi:hypothetical protein
MSFAFSRSLTIDHTKCGSSDSTNFPVLFAGTYSYLATVANGGNVQNSSGYDIAFSSDSAGLTPLSWEIDSYNAATGAVAFWVKIPTVSHTTDTVFYLWYGDATISTLQSTASGVWDSNYAAVTHFRDSSGLTANDSTSNANNGVVTGVTVASSAKIGTASDHSGSSANFIRIPTSSSLNVVGAITMEAWVYPTASGTYQAVIDRDTPGSSSVRDYSFYLAATAVGDLYVAMGGQNHGPFTPLTPQWALNTWSQVVVTHNGSTGLAVYVNGQPVYTNNTMSFPTTASHDVYYGSELGNSFPLTGRLDECRISKTTRSADWVLTQYNSQNSPATFYTVGSAGSGAGPSAAKSCVFINL